MLNRIKIVHFNTSKFELFSFSSEYGSSSTFLALLVLAQQIPGGALHLRILNYNSIEKRMGYLSTASIGAYLFGCPAPLRPQ